MPERNKSRQNGKTDSLPAIPSKRYFTIGEASRLCDVKPHVLRYWEQEFPQLKPSKRRGNRRYYQHKDVELVREIRHLLYEKGFTIGGARMHLSQARAAQKEKTDDLGTVASTADKQMIQDTIHELENILSNLQD